MSDIKTILNQRDFNEYLKWAEEKYGVFAGNVPIPFVLLRLILNEIKKTTVTIEDVNIVKGVLKNDSFNNLEIEDVKSKFLLFYEGKNLFDSALFTISGNTITFNFAYNVNNAKLLKLF